MALIFMDGFQHYATADIAKKWNSIGSSPAITAGVGRRGGNVLELSTNSRSVTKAFGNISSFVLGFAFRVGTALPSGNTYILHFYDTSSAQISLQLNQNGTFTVSRAGNFVTGGTSANAISASTWYYIELKATVSDSIAADSCKLKVNGVDWLNVAAGQDLKNTSNASVNSFTLFGNGASGSQYIQDLYFLDQTGPAPLNDFLGDCRIDTVYPDAEGNYLDLTPSTGTSHYALVDEATPNTTDYNSSSTAGQRDSYGFQSVPALAAQTIYGVQVNVAALKDDAGARSLAPFVRHGGVNGDGSAVALSTSQAYISSIHPVNPSTGAAWTEAQINAMEAGVLVS